MVPEVVVIAEPVRVTSRLAVLGLDRAELMESVRAGLLAQRNTTPHHPMTAGGFNRWAEGFAALCDPLVKRGWQKIELENVPLAVDHTRKIAVTVSGGNSATGIDPTDSPAGVHLRTRRPKGRGTGDLIERAAEVQPSLLTLIGEDPLPQRVRPYNEHGFALFFLLSYEDAEGAVRVELARPALIDAKGEITNWSERIILGELPEDPEGARDVSERDEPVHPEVTVLRKAT